MSITKEYLSHFSAAYQWDIPFLDIILGEENTNKYKNSPYVDITVTDPNLRNRKKEHRTHLHKLPLPPGAIKKKGACFVASPELVFLELANMLDFHRLIFLGLQICSHPPGRTSMAISTKRKMETFLRKTSGHRGHLNAKRALKYVENSAGSHMESIAFMILTLPHSLGGYGLSGASFNHEILLDEKANRQLSKKRCFADLYYDEAKLAVEYDSFAHHSRPSEQGKDLRRATTLERKGIHVVRFSTIQLYDKNACEEFALNIARRLGKRISIRTQRFYEAHNNLRSLLPSKENR